MIGRTNARRGARRIFAVLQNRRLNQHIVYSIVDEVGPFPWICNPVDNSIRFSWRSSRNLWAHLSHYLDNYYPVISAI